MILTISSQDLIPLLIRYAYTLSTIDIPPTITISPGGMTICILIFTTTFKPPQKDDINSSEHIVLQGVGRDPTGDVADIPEELIVLPPPPLPDIGYIQTPINIASSGSCFAKAETL